MARTVRDVMTGSPVCASSDTDVFTAARLMRDNNIGTVLITDGDRLQGMVTDRDLVIRCLAEGGDISSASIGSIASGAEATVSADDDLEKAVDLMREHAVRRLPVTDSGRLVGIVSIGDLAIEKDERSALADVSAAPPNR